jgi:hypothetical protein
VSRPPAGVNVEVDRGSFRREFPQKKWLEAGGEDVGLLFESVEDLK